MIVELKDVCNKGTSNIRQKDIVSKPGDYPIYGASGLAGNVNFYQQEKASVAVVKDGAGIGRALLLPAKASIISTMQYLIPKDNVLPEYLYYAVRNMHLEKYYSGATIPHIYFKDYKKEKFNLVSLNQQRKIITLFNEIENTINKRKKKLSKLDTLVKARFVEMFGDPIINTKDLSLVSLGKLCTLKAGEFTAAKEIHANKDNINRYPCFGGNGVRGYVDNYTHDGNYSLIGRQGALCGNVQLTAGKFRNTEHAILVKPNVQVNYYWLFMLLKLEKLNRFSSGAAQPGLAVKTLNKIFIPIADLNLQNEFASFAQQVDKSKVVNNLIMKYIISIYFICSLI